MASNEIFISYRRADTRTEAVTVARVIDAVLGRGTAFHDVSGLLPGRDWGAQLRTALAGSRLTLVLVGRRFHELVPTSGHDVVRAEIQASMASPRCTVVPVAVGCEPWRSAHWLPEPYRSFPALHWITLPDTGTAALAAFADALVRCVAESLHRDVIARPSLRALSALAAVERNALEHYVATVRDPFALGLLMLATHRFDEAARALHSAPSQHGLPEARFLSSLQGAPAGEVPSVRLATALQLLAGARSPLAEVLTAAAHHDGFERRGIPSPRPDGQAVPSSVRFARAVAAFRKDTAFWQDRAELAWLASSGTFAVSPPLRACLADGARWPTPVRFSSRHRHPRRQSAHR